MNDEKTLDRDEVVEKFRLAVLAALDATALECFADHGVAALTAGKGATDADLPALFDVIDAQVDLIAERCGETVVDRYRRIDVKFHPFEGFHASASIADHLGYCATFGEILDEINSFRDAEADRYRDIDTPADTPSLDTSFHDAERMA